MTLLHPGPWRIVRVMRPDPDNWHRLVPRFEVWRER